MIPIESAATTLLGIGHQVILRCLYALRVVHVEALKLLMRLLLLVFALEMRVRPVAGPEDPEEKRILIVVVGGLGDCLLFDPLLRRLKEHWPNARIDVVTGQCFEQMWELIESVDHLLYVPSPGDGGWYRACVRVLRTIRRNRYDIVAEGIAMLPRRGIHWVFTALIFDASRAPVRIGTDRTGRYVGLRPRRLRPFSRIHAAEEPIARPPAVKGRPNRYLTHVIDVLPDHERPYHVSSRIFEPLGIPYFRRSGEPGIRPQPDLERWARSLLRSQWGSSDDIIVGVSLEVTKEIKSWPVENFLSVVEKGIGDGLRFVLLGLARTARDSPLAGIPKRALLDLSARTRLGEMIAIIDQCDVFLSCDAGPSHIAQACGVPSIVLFGPSNEMEFGPADRKLHTLVTPPEELACRPCVLGPCVLPRTCMHSISPEAVYAALSARVRALRRTESA